MSLVRAALSEEAGLWNQPEPGSNLSSNSVPVDWLCCPSDPPFCNVKKCRKGYLLKGLQKNTQGMKVVMASVDPGPLVSKNMEKKQNNVL